MLTVSGAAAATCFYNGEEQLVSRTLVAPFTPGVTLYLYDTQRHLLSEAWGPTALTAVIKREYIWLGDMPVMVVDGVDTATPVLYAVHADHLMRPIRMTDATKATVWNAVWTPWGTAQSIAGTATLNLRFPGQYFQMEQGLHYNWHRHYDPTSARYAQPDPLGFPDGPSRYAYAANSPLMNIDPDGLDISFPYTLKMWRLFTQPIPPLVCMGPSEDHALSSCQEAAGKSKRDWLNFCDASMFTPPVDATRPERCRQYVNSSRIEKRNWCYNEYGD